MKRLLLILSTALFCTCAYAQPKVAVTDLTYKDEVREFFYFEAASSKSKGSYSGSYRDSDHSSSARERGAASHESSYVRAAGESVRIEFGELRRFTADLKGEMLKSDAFRLVQAKPYLAKESGEKIYDIIDRIKKGYFPGADYVMFGTVNSVEWRNDRQPVQGTSNTMLLYSLEVGVEFNLINTKNYEVKAAFSAVGEGNDNKIWSQGVVLTPNKARVMQAVSRSLAQEGIGQLMSQFDGGRRPTSSRSEGTTYESRSHTRSEEQSTLKTFK